MNRLDLSDFRLAAAVRLFALVALATPALLAQDLIPIVGLVILAVIWMTGLATRGLIPSSPLLVITFEAIAVGVTLGADLDRTAPLFGALLVAPLAGGLRGGARGALQASAAELLSLTVTALQLQGQIEKSTVGAAVAWSLVAVGVGLVSALIHGLRASSDDTLAPYRDAKQLISQLLELSGQLSEGLDPVSISQRMMAAAREEIPFIGGVVYARRGQELTPLIDAAQGAALSTSLRPRLVEQAWAAASPVVHGTEIALPLVTEAGVVAVIAASLPSTVVADKVQLDRELHRLAREFRAEALQLDAALLFTAVRDRATADERRRLAREVHDGVAQDVASLGYLVDDLEDSATTPEQAETFQRLRSEITSVVAELRRSVFSLRNDPEAASSLGASVSALAHHVTGVSGTPVHLDLDEGAARLRSDVEAELLRIAQEGMNNAVRHGHPQNIWVTVRVKAPTAEVVVRDDGLGLQTARPDSHGIRIMRERAALIGATLDLHNAAEGGTILRVAIAGHPGDGKEPTHD